MQTKRSFVFPVVIRLIDILLIWGVYKLSSSIWDLAWSRENYVFTILLWLVPIAWLLLSGIFRIYNDRDIQYGPAWNIKRILSAFIMLVALVLIVVVFGKFKFSRLALSFLLMADLVVLLTTARLRWQLIGFIRAKGYTPRMSLLIANSAELDDFGTWALGHPEMGFQDTHVLDVDAYGNSESLVKEIRKISDHEIVYEMVLGSFYTEVSYLAELINVAEEYGSRIRLIENTPSVIKGKTAMIPWGPFQVLAVRQEPLNNVTHRAIKQLADIGITLIVIIFFYWWLYAIIAVLIKLSSQGSVIFKQRRIGKGGQPFDCYKFRSMRTPVIDSDNFRKITQNRDDRITWIGKLLRVTNLDELPQFINVLKGDMSVIGPRPHMVVEDEKISTLLVKYKIRRFVRPGITGWAAVNGYRGGTENMELMQERINHDIYYIENWTIWLDTKILFLTAWKMLTLSTDAQ